jgi:arylsulfatase A-like enzyme
MKGELEVLDRNSGRAGIPFYQAQEGLRDPARYAALYAEEIQYADHWVGQVVSAMEKRSGIRGTVILLTADHGESLGESGWFFQHGQSTAPELARVPFIVVAPGLERGRIRGPVSHVDVAPTLLALAGLPELPDASGRPLRAQLLGEESLENRLVFCDTEGESAAYGSGSWTRVAGSTLSDRPETPLRPTRSESARLTAAGKWRPTELDPQALKALAEYIKGRAALVAAGPMAPEHIEELRALGYGAPLEYNDEEPTRGGPPAPEPHAGS